MSSGEDDAHRLLRVVAAVAEAVRGRGHELAVAEAAVEPLDARVCGASPQSTASMKMNPSARPTSGASTMNTPISRMPCATSTPEPPLATAAPAMPPTSACDDDVGKPEPERDQVPDDRAHQPGEDHANDEHVLLHDILGDRVGDMRAEDEERDEVEDRGPQHSDARAQHARRHDGGDGVGGVVEAVDEVEAERDDHDGDENEVLHEVSCV